MTQKILFPMEYMKITTGVNEASHLGSNAIDNAGKYSGIENVFSPFTGTIKRIYEYGHTVWLESNEPVEFADGTVDFAVCSFTHDNIVSDLSVGQVIQQKKVFYQEGTAGQATGNHLHLEVGKGKFTGNGWYKNKYGKWVINNSYVPWNAFFTQNDTVIINGYGYPWKRSEEMVDETVLALIYRTVCGTEITEYGKTNRLNKQTAKQALAEIRSSDLAKKHFVEVQSAKKMVNDNLIVEMR